MLVDHKGQEIGYNLKRFWGGIVDTWWYGHLCCKSSHKVNGQKRQKNRRTWGVTFKEDCSDIYNSRVIDVINELKKFGADISIYYSWADSKEVHQEYGLALLEKVDEPTFNQYAAIAFAVAHKQFKQFELKTTRRW